MKRISLRSLFQQESGHHGHKGRPGQVGGSLPGGNSGKKQHTRKPMGSAGEAEPTTERYNVNGISFSKLKVGKEIYVEFPGGRGDADLPLSRITEGSVEGFRGKITEIDDIGWISVKPVIGKVRIVPFSAVKKVF